MARRSKRSLGDCDDAAAASVAPEASQEGALSVLYSRAGSSGSRDGCWLECAPIQNMRLGS